MSSPATSSKERLTVDAHTELSQRRASDPRASAWVSANAGAGKTKVLTDRVVRLLLAGTPPSRILCLTFTKAAAANMAIRVFGLLGEWVTLDDEALLRTGAGRFHAGLLRLEGFLDRHLTDEEELIVPVILRDGEAFLGH